MTTKICTLEQALKTLRDNYSWSQQAILVTDNIGHCRAPSKRIPYSRFEVAFAKSAFANQNTIPEGLLVCFMILRRSELSDVAKKKEDDHRDKRKEDIRLAILKAKEQEDK